MSEKKSTSWQNVRQQMSHWPKPALIALVKDLYEASPDKRDFLHARFQADENSGAPLEKYRRKIVKQATTGYCRINPPCIARHLQVFLRK